MEMFKLTKKNVLNLDIEMMLCIISIYSCQKP